MLPIGLNYSVIILKEPQNLFIQSLINSFIISIPPLIIYIFCSFCKGNVCLNMSNVFTVFKWFVPTVFFQRLIEYITYLQSPSLSQETPHLSPPPQPQTHEPVLRGH